MPALPPSSSIKSLIMKELTMKVSSKLDSIMLLQIAPFLSVFPHPGQAVASAVFVKSDGDMKITHIHIYRQNGKIPSN
jgi:hypothetical protein